MEELIKQAFLHIEVIGPRVQDGHYDLIGPNGEIILPSVWEKVIEPDWAVTMHMWPMDKARAMPPNLGPMPPLGHPARPAWIHRMQQMGGLGGGVRPPSARPGGPSAVPPPPPHGFRHGEGRVPGPSMGGPRVPGPTPQIIDAVPPPRRTRNPPRNGVLGWMTGTTPKPGSGSKK
jgi:hypothetical protein